jgi:hypothetical protein
MVSELQRHPVVKAINHLNTIQPWIINHPPTTPATVTHDVQPTSVDVVRTTVEELKAEELTAELSPMIPAV